MHCDSWNSGVCVLRDMVPIDSNLCLYDGGSEDKTKRKTATRERIKTRKKERCQTQKKGNKRA